MRMLFCVVYLVFGVLQCQYSYFYQGPMFSILSSILVKLGNEIENDCSI